MKKINWKKLLLSALCVVLLTASAVTVTTLASEPKPDAMTAIRQALNGKQVGETVAISNDGYIGIPVELTTYYDYGKFGQAKTGYNGTPLIIYVVNTATERIGAKTDVEIITSMLDDGYVVAVLDYKNHAKSSSPNIDWSTQTIRVPIMNGTHFTDVAKTPKGTYQSNYIVPAGYDVSIGKVFWEADKHGADGTLEKIVENWNSDFRGYFRNTIIYWRNAAGEQKATQNGFDGSKPQWYSDAAGKKAVDASSDDAKYIKVQHTLAKDVTDCVGKDGTPIDITLHMDIVYPTTAQGDKAIKPVPIAVLASSSEYLSTASTGSGLRPQHNGFLFNGYAGAEFDYLYQPMAQKDYYGYYDGQKSMGALTGDRMNYGLHLYNDKRINTAAMRYLRYLTLTEPETYSFDINAIGVFGNSKGGWFTFLGEEELQNPTELIAGKTLAESIDARINAYTSKRTFENHNGESRYQNSVAGYTKNGVTIDAGELQPWLTYKDENGVIREVPSHCNWVYASNGSQNEDITENHVPTFIALHLKDDFSTYANQFAEVVNNFKNIPYFYVVVDLGHTFAYGPDAYYGYDTYQAMFDFAGYYLKNEPIKVVFVSPDNEEGGAKTTSPIRIKFSGAVEQSEVEKIGITTAGKPATGSWSYTAGKTEWIFTPDALDSGVAYTVTVPANLKGDNGKEIGEAYTSVFYTEIESVSATDTVKTEKGTYITFDAPSMASASDARVRFHVTNDAANVVGLYLVSGFDVTNPDSSTVGALVDTVNLRGAGYYEIDVSEIVSAADGKITFLLKTEKEVQTINTTAAISSATVSTYSRKNGETTAPDGTPALGFYVNENIKPDGTQQYPYEVFYTNLTDAFQIKNLFNPKNSVFPEDYGRKFSVSIRVYDTASRTIQIDIGAAYTKDNGVHDFDKRLYTFKTEANQWTTLNFDYTVYENHYGDRAATSKTLTFKLGSTGVNENPIYIEDFKVTEYVTAVELDSGDPASVVLGARDTAYKANSEGMAFTIGSTGYNTLKAALAAAKSGETVKLNKNYTTTSTDDFSGWEALTSVTLDLNGYKIFARGGKSLITAKATSNTGKTAINLVNGSVYLYNAPLVSYEGSSSAGRGKEFVINAESVNILNTTDSRLYYVISAPSADTAINATINLSDSTIRFDKRYNTRHTVSVFPASTGSLNVKYNIKGGTIQLDTLARVTIAENANKVELIPDIMSSYTKVLAPSSLDISIIAFARTDGMAGLEGKSTSLGITTYETSVGELSTKYGIVPKEYSNADLYPFIMFSERGTFIGAYNTFVDAGARGVLVAARNYVANPWNGTDFGGNPKEAFIVMRRNYTFDASRDAQYENFAQTQGTVNIDLGGYTLSAGNTAIPIFPAISKGYSASMSGNPIFPTTVNVSNGIIHNYKSGVVAMKTWDSAGGGTIANKHFNFNFTNVTFGFVQDADCAGLIAHGWGYQASPEAAAPFNFTYNDCTFDLRTTQGKYSPVIFGLNAASDKFIKLTIKVNGGKIVAKDPSKVTIVDPATGEDYGSSITFAPGSNGELIKYYVPSGATVTGGNYIGEKGISYTFKKAGTEGSDDVYTLQYNPLSTQYGTIGDSYASADSYPFAVFNYKTGSFVGAYSTMRAAFEKVRSDYNNSGNAWANGSYGSNETTYVILMRRAYTTTGSDYYDNYAQIKGTAYFDLGGFTLTQGSETNGVFANVDSKGWGGKIFPTTISVYNGKINVTTKSVVRSRIWATVGNGGMTDKKFTWNFDDIEFGFASGATSSSLLLEYMPQNTGEGYSADVPAPFIYNYNDCKFNMANAPAGATVFNVATGTDTWIKSTVAVTGSSIENAASLSINQLYLLDSTNPYGSSIILKKGSDGEYLKVKVASGATAPMGAVPTDSGSLAYSKSGTFSGYDIYTLVSLKTAYGDIPAEYASVKDFPFVLFDKNGFVGAYKTFYGAQSGGAVDKAIYSVLKLNSYDGTKWVGDVNEAIVLMRRDYTLEAGEYHNNLGHAKGNLTIDLGGFTLYENTNPTTNAKNPSIFHSTAKRYNMTIGNMVFPTVYTVKNGSIKVYGASVIRFETYQCDSASGVISDKNFTWNFKDVTFGLQPGATATSLVTGAFAKHTGNAAGGGSAPYTVSLTNCTFDLKTNAPASPVKIFGNSFTEDYYINLTVKVNGGSVVANSLSGVSFYDQNTTELTSVIFGASDSSEFSVRLTAGSPIPSHTHIFHTENGKELSLRRTSSEDGFDVYTLAEGEVTKYGTIPAMYTDKEIYPFIIFRGGEFISAQSIFGKDATDSALHLSKTDGSVILLRRDFIYTESQYNNLSQTNGAITIDLDGHTIYCRQSGGHSLFYAQKKTTYDSSITIKNGSILTAKNPIVMFACWKGSTGSYTGNYNFNITFEGVTLGADAGKTPSCLIAVVSENAGEPDSFASLTLKDCTIDISGLEGTNLIKSNADQTAVTLTAKLEGNTVIKGYDVSATEFFALTDGSTAILEESVKLIAVVGTDKVFNTANGNMIFFKTGEEEGKNVFALLPEAYRSFVIKTSVSFYRDFVYNVYVPKETFIKSITFANASVNISALEVENIEGRDYYKLTHILTATRALESFTVTVELDKSATTSTLCIVNYAKDVIEAEGATAEEIALMKDMLSYIKAAYTFFDIEDNGMIGAVDDILGVNYNETSTPDMSKADGALAPEGTGFIGIALHLGTTPSYRFYYEGEAAPSYTFTVGDRTVTATEGSDPSGKKYLEIKVYAYEMLLDVTFGSHTYNAYTYYAWASTYEAEAASVVERLIKYCESAEAYRQTKAND